MQLVTDKLERRRKVGNWLFAVLGSAGVGVTIYAFMDPEKGRYTPDVDFSNWSGTHHVHCKCDAIS